MGPPDPRRFWRPLSDACEYAQFQRRVTSGEPAKREDPPLPPGLGAAGGLLWRSTLAEFELSGPELALLAEACRVADRLTTINDLLSGAPLSVEGSMGQPRPNPLLAEARVAGAVARPVGAGVGVAVAV